MVLRGLQGALGPEILVMHVAIVCPRQLLRHTLPGTTHLVV